MPTVLKVIFIILLIVIAVLAVLYYFGSRMQRRQVAQQEQMESMKQNVSLLIIDKKKLKITEAGLPDVVLEQTPWYAKRTKVPVVKAKIGPKIMTFMCDPVVYDRLPVKKECMVTVSGIYIMDIKSVRGGTVPPVPKKKSFFDRFRRKKDNK